MKVSHFQVYAMMLKLAIKRVASLSSSPLINSMATKLPYINFVLYGLPIFVLSRIQKNVMFSKTIINMALFLRYLQRDPSEYALI